MNDFKYHRISEKERKKIKKEAKKLLDDFVGKLEKIKEKEGHFETGDGTREEGEGWDVDENFESVMMGNAPFVEDGFIVAEKGGWK